MRRALWLNGILAAELALSWCLVVALVRPWTEKVLLAAVTRQALDEGCTEIEIAVPGDSVDIDFGDDDDVDFILSDENDTPWLKLTDEPNDANTWSYNLTVLGVRTRSEAIRALCESGAVCEVMGHCWRDGRPGEGFSEDDGTYFSYTDYHPGVSFQTCRICGKTETRRWTDWD